MTEKKKYLLKAPHASSHGSYQPSSAYSRMASVNVIYAERERQKDKEKKRDTIRERQRE